MRRLAFTPRWIGGLLFCLAAAAVCALLGHWQWDVAQARRGTLQNTAYALNWWLFAVLFVGFWFKALRDTVIRDAGSPQQQQVHRQLPPTRAGRVREPAPARALVLPSAQEDPEVAEWNAWLREMNEDPRG